VQLNPTGAQTINQPSVSAPLSVNYLSQAFSNGVIFADAFCGLGTIGGIATPACSADICTKLLAANKYAVANGVTQVDITHAQGVQACSVNPYNGISSGAPNTAANLVNNFGATHFQTSVMWTITNSNITMHGMGAWATQVEFTGSSAAAILFVNGSTGTGTIGAAGIQGIKIDGMYFYGDTNNVTNGIQLTFVNRSRLDSVQVWGVSGCGFLTQAAVTTTFIQPRVSFADALFAGILNTHTTPANGICLGGFSAANTGSVDTTSGSVIDAGMEGLTNIGIFLQSADQERIVGGTSEENLYGIWINLTTQGVNSGTSNKYNKFETIDLEGNTKGTVGVDVTDNGQFNMFENLLSDSPCSGCNAIQLSSSAEDWIIGGFIPQDAVSGQGNGIINFGANTAGTCTAVGTITEWFKGAPVFIPYCSTAP
jgi:hypothetical protein